MIAVAEFAQKISLAHEDFAGQVQQIVKTFQEKNKNLKAERYSFMIQLHSL